MENSEIYLNHPTFGLLYRVCVIDKNQELYTTLYAQRLFFLVTINTNEELIFDPIGRSDSKLLVESRLRLLRKDPYSLEYKQLQAVREHIF